MDSFLAQRLGYLVDAALEEKDVIEKDKILVKVSTLLEEFNRTNE